MKIVFNKNKKTVPENCTLEQLLIREGLKRAAVWINGQQIFFYKYPTTVLKENDEIKTLAPLGGG